MSPIEAIKSLPEMQGKINRLRHGLQCECDDVAEQWDGLGRVGGQRADHAALLLSRLRPHLAALAAMATAIESQITGMVLDPFERDAEAVS